MDVVSRPPGTEVQYVWVYVQKKFVVDSIVDFCRQARQVDRIPEVVAPPGPNDEPPPWRSLLKLLVHSLPPPYAPHEWCEFWRDVEALLSSSVKAAEQLHARTRHVMAKAPGAICNEGSRLPSLLVTDRWKLGQASMDGMTRNILAEAASLKESDLLPVVLAADFKTLCGNLKVKPPVEVSNSNALRDFDEVVEAVPPACQAPGGRAGAAPTVGSVLSHAFADPDDGIVENDEHARFDTGGLVVSVETRSPMPTTPAGLAGVKQSTQNSPPAIDVAAATDAAAAPQDMVADEESQVSREIVLSPGIYVQRFKPRTSSPSKNGVGLGARCIAVMSDGQCAYSAVSSDGMRGVQANGPWQIINGHIVLGANGKKVHVSHLRLTQSGNEVLDDVAYPEAIHVSLDELHAVFDHPVSLGDCVPRVGESLRAELLQLWMDRDGLCQPLRRSVAGGGSVLRSPKRVGSPGSPRKHASPGPRTPEPPDTQQGLSSPRNTAAVHRPPQPKKILLNTPAAAWAAEPPTAVPLSQRFAEGGGTTMAALASATGPADTAGTAGGLGVFTLCPLRPGSYRHTTGIPDAEVYRHFEMTLRPDGTYTYCETRFRTVVRSTHSAPSWWVEAGQLVLSARGKEDSYAFILKEPHGKRDTEQRIARLEIPVATVLARCIYEPFQQQVEPFPRHRPIAEAERISGVVDPCSPALLDPVLQLDRVPINAFEALLREHGLKTEDIVSDIRFLDNDEDGMITVDELYRLQSYGEAVASPELLNELRDALLRRYGLLDDAFEALMQSVASDADEPPVALPHLAAKGIAGAKRVATFTQFERFLQQSAKDSRQKSKCALLQAWLEKSTLADIQAVFLSMNPNKGPTIDLVDFQTLSLHTAMLSVRRVEHFKRWVCELFGRGDESFERAFHTLDTGHTRKFKDRTFIQAVEKLGYPCGPTGIRAIFGMLDRNFKGVVTIKEFVTLRGFDSGRLLQGLQELKRFAEERFGGLSECYKNLLKLEQSRKQAGNAKSVSFQTLKKACDQGGFTKAFGDVDLHSLFLFLDSATGQSSNGYLTFDEWSLMAGFDSQTITGNPARLRKFLEDAYGGPEEAFNRILGLYQARAVRERVEQLAISGLVQALRARQRRPVAPTATMSKMKVVTAFKRSTQIAMPAHARSQLSELVGSMAKARPHTHMGTSGCDGADGGGGAVPGVILHGQGRRSIVGEGTTGFRSARSSSCSVSRSGLPYHISTPVIPEQLRGELWAPRERRCASATPADQTLSFSPLPGISASVPLGKVRFSTLRSGSCSARGIRNGSSCSGGMSAISWDPL